MANPLSHTELEADDSKPWAPALESSVEYDTRPESPYPGLRSFRTEEANVFYGRKRETRELIELLASSEHRVITIEGEMGVGKSSLIQAGLLPQLYAGQFLHSERWIQLRITPEEQGGNPFQTLAHKLTPLLQNYGSRYHFISDLLRRQPNEWAQLNDPLLADSPPGTEILLIIDPLEELLTTVTPELRNAFIQLLLTAVQTPRQRVLLSVRDDYLEGFKAWPKFAEILEQSSYRLERPGFGALFEMISGPANQLGLAFEPDLALRILKDTSDEPQVLARLAFTLAQLCRDHDNDTLSHTRYEEIQGVHGAIDYCAEKALSQFEANQLDTLDALDALEEVFRALVQIDEHGEVTRPYVPLYQLSTNDRLSRLVKILLELGFLIRIDENKAKPLLRIAHSAVISCWSRLADWVRVYANDSNILTRLKHESLEWERRGRPGNMQWHFQQLNQAKEMIARRKPVLTQREQEFIQPETQRLIEQLDQLQLDDQQRCEIGERLAQVGDNRPGVELNSEGLPDIVWCKVPAGVITLESGKGKFRVESCSIAKYPLTWIQYRSFLEAEDGYRNPDWWLGLASRAEQPGEQYHRFDNHPADNVSWFDAIAFCSWLSYRLGYRVRLPSEWEWQQAASAEQTDYNFPWGPLWLDGYTNSLESGLNRTLAVGLYPFAAAPTGALDMSGNVWEWCLNRYDQAELEQAELAGYDRRVVRGGSWRNGQANMMIQFRDLDSPDVRTEDFGFRLLKPAAGSLVV